LAGNHRGKLGAALRFPRGNNAARTQGWRPSRLSFVGVAAKLSGVFPLS